MVSKLIILSLVVCVANAATFRTRYLPEKPEEFADKEGCYIQEISDVIGFGKTITPEGHCYEIYCSRTNVEYATCGAVGTDDTMCYVTKEDLSVPYPQCCPTVECDSENDIV